MRLSGRYASKYALGMHRLPRWLVGTAASLLGLSLLLVRWGLWASGSTVIEGAEGMRAVLIAIQTEPAVLVYGAIVFLLLVGFALLIPTPNGRNGSRVTRSERAHSRRQPDHHQGSLGLGVKLVPSLPNSEQVQLSLSGRTGAQRLSGSNHP